MRGCGPEKGTVGGLCGGNLGFDWIDRREVPREERGDSRRRDRRLPLRTYLGYFAEAGRENI